MVVILCLLKTDSILHFGAKERFLHFRYDMSKPEDHYWQDHIVRTLQQIRECARSQKFSCAHQPLLDIPLENVILDELHLMLRVTGGFLQIIF